MPTELIPVADISPTTINPRTTFVDESLDQLATSITSVGLAQPITVWPAANALFTKPQVEGAGRPTLSGRRHPPPGRPGAGFVGAAAPSLPARLPRRAHPAKGNRHPVTGRTALADRFGHP